MTQRVRIDDIMINEQTITWQTKDGRSLHIRPLQNDDAPLLVTIFDHMSSDSRYRRFHQPVDNLSIERVLEEAEGISATVPDDGFGLIALADDVPVGAARYVIFAEGRAEIAVSIRDEYQNGGLGKQLVNLLAQEAKRRGIQQLTAEVQAVNTAALRILEKLPFPRTQSVDGAVIQVEIDLTAVPQTDLQ
jgi:RimJ/RimL family protein N-acetyltransferase